MIDHLRELAKTHPQQAFAVLNRSIKFKATFLFRTIPNASAYASKYDDALEALLTTLFGRPMDNNMILQASIPIGKGGIGLNINSIDYSNQQLLDSLAMTYSLTRNIIYGDVINTENDQEIRLNISKRKKKYWDSKLETLMSSSTEFEITRLKEMNMPGVNSWLNVIPVKWKKHLLLGKREFQDAFLLRFNKKPMDLPIVCPALNCRAEFDLIHCDICPHGGVIHRRHDYIKSILAHHAEKAFGCSSVDIEPDIGPIEDEAMDIINGNLTAKARADFVVKSFNGLHSSTYFDVSIVSPVCESHKTQTIEKSIANAEKRKNDSYAQRIKVILGGDFMPCVFSSGGVIGPAARKVIDCISAKKASSSIEKVNDVKDEIRTDLSMSLQKSRIQGLRASRSSLSSQLRNFQQL